MLCKKFCCSHVVDWFDSYQNSDFCEKLNDGIWQLSYYIKHLFTSCVQKTTETSKLNFRGFRLSPIVNFFYVGHTPEERSNFQLFSLLTLSIAATKVRRRIFIILAWQFSFHTSKSSHFIIWSWILKTIL